MATLIAKEFLRRAAGKNGFDKTFTKYNVDLVVSLLDCQLCSLSTAAGYPHATVPLCYADNYNKCAYGINVVAGIKQENTITQFMGVWGRTHPKLRKSPPQFVAWDTRNSSM